MSIEKLKSLLLIDDQTDCACEFEKYQTDKCKFVYLDGNNIETKITDDYGNIEIPISTNKIEYVQIKNILLQVFKFAKKINIDEIYEYEKIVVNTKFNFNKLEKHWHRLISDFLPRYSNRVIRFDEVEDNRIYFIKQPEFTGVFTFNLRGEGLFIMSDAVSVAVF